MTQSEEMAYIQGQRAILKRQLRQILSELGYDGSEASAAAWVLEREAAISALRRVCEKHGDNDWTEDLHLADVIEKHLERQLQS